MFETLLLVAVADPAVATGGTAPVDPGAAEEWADCSGAVLAKLVADRLPSLEQVPDTMAGDGELLDLVTGAARVEAWAAATRAKVIARFYARVLDEHRARGLLQADGRGSAAGASHGFDDDAFTRNVVAANVSVELGMPLPVAEREVRFAVGLARDSDLRRALAAGRLDVAQARAIVGELDQLNPLTQTGVRRTVVAGLITDPAEPGSDRRLVRELRAGRKRVWDLPPADLRAIIRRESARLDPDQASARAEAARAGRHVRYHQRRDAMAELVLHGPAEVLGAAFQHLNFTAHAVRHQHRRSSALAGGATVDQLRHDIAVAWLTDNAHGLSISYTVDALPAPPAEPGEHRRSGVVLTGRPQVMINVAVAETTLLGLDELPAVLHGPAGPTPIPADLARQIAYDPEQTTWRRILCDPATGIAIDVSRSYRPPKRLAEFVKVRDGQRSRFPGSSAGHVELDHIIRYQHSDPTAGGPTSSGNLGTDGLWDHHLKTDGAITVEGDANGPLTYGLRGGRRHLSWPHQYLDPADPAEREREREEREERGELEERRPDDDFGDPPF
jgi:hypothetical protein